MSYDIEIEYYDQDGAIFYMAKHHSGTFYRNTNSRKLDSYNSFQ